MYQFVTCLTFYELVKHCLNLFQLPWPVHIDQLALLQLLSSSATQEFRYYGGTEKVDFVGADEEPLVVYDDEMTAVSSYNI